MTVRGNLLAYRTTADWRVRRPEQAYGPDRLDVKTLPIAEAGTALDADKATITAYQERIKQYRKDGWAVHFLYRTTRMYPDYDSRSRDARFHYATQRVGKLGGVREIKLNTWSKVPYMCYGYIAINPDAFASGGDTSFYRNNDHVESVIEHIITGQRTHGLLGVSDGVAVVNLTSGMIAYGYRSIKDFTAHVDQLPDAFWADPDEDADAALTNWTATERAQAAHSAYRREKNNASVLRDKILNLKQRIQELQTELAGHEAELAQAQANLPALERAAADAQATVGTQLTSRYRLDATDLTAHLA